jgi:alkylation response protein AidB-like acyl-CoA dehydrogenase
MGLWGLTAPEKYGGGLDLVSCCVIQEELAQTFIPVEIGEVSPLLYACVGEQASKYLEPCLAGERRAILAAREPGCPRPEDWTTSASPLEGGAAAGFSLNGRKSIGLQPSSEDFFIVFAKIPAGGEASGLTAFLLDVQAPGLEISKNGDTRLDLRDCRVGSGAVLGQPGEALSLASQEAPKAWIQTGARYLGLTQRLLEMSVDYARDWVSLGAALAVRPAVQRMVAEMSVELESTRWLVYHAAWLVDTRPDAPIRLPAAQVRLATGELLQHAVDRTTMIFAGPGPSTEIEPQRLVRSLVPADALELSLEYARAAIATEELQLSS